MALMTAEQILIAKPEAVFTDPDDIHSKYIELAKVWHPDNNKNPKALEVFKRIGILKEAAEKLASSGLWPGAPIVIEDDKGNKRRIVSYLKSATSDACTTYLCSRSIIMVFTKDCADLGKRYVDNTKKLTYIDSKMKAEFEQYVPRVTMHHATADGGYVVVIDRDKDLIRVRDLIDHHGGSLLPRHACWIGSSLFNLLCFLWVNKIEHGAISPDTYYVSPAKHSGYLLGGWEFSTPYGSKVKALPARTVKILGTDPRIADGARDRSLARMMIREMLGDSTGMTLKTVKDFPQAVAEWLMHVSDGSPIKDYADWHKTLEAGYGKRRFTTLPTTVADVYGKT